jgi:LAGLIDADG DNA endonuclease family protein
LETAACRNTGRFHRLHAKHKTQHRSLAELKYRAFANYISMPPHEFDQQLQGKNYPCVQFASLTSPEFSEWHSYFYRGGRKIVPADIAQHPSPLADAVWFMDDGASGHAGVTIQTHCFDLEEVRLLVQSLKDSSGVRASLGKNKGARIIYVGAAELSAFRRLVRPYVLPELRYKLVTRSIPGRWDR